MCMFDLKGSGRIAGFVVGILSLSLGTGIARGQCEQPLFPTAAGYYVDGVPRDLAVADLNGDGWLDMVVGSPGVELMGEKDRH